MWSTSDMPPLATVARGRIAPNMAAWKGWAIRQNAWDMLFFDLRLLLVAWFVVFPVRLLRMAFGLRTTTRRKVRDFLAHGYPVAIWTPPGEWRVARMVADLAQIIADGGEVEPPKDED